MWAEVASRRIIGGWPPQISFPVSLPRTYLQNPHNPPHKSPIINSKKVQKMKNSSLADFVLLLICMTTHALTHKYDHFFKHGKCCH